MATSHKPMCVNCIHLNKDDVKLFSCKAFPKGIPENIYMNRSDHRKPYPNDNGIRYEPVNPKLAVDTADNLPV